MPEVRESAGVKTLRGPAFFLVAIFSTVLFAGRVLAQDVTFTTAIPVAQGELVTRFQTLDAVSSQDSRNLKSFGFPLVFAYGIRSYLTLFAEPPLVWNFLRQSEGTERVTRYSSGFGDTLVFLRYTLISRDWLTGMFHLAPLAGFYVPTGSNDKGDSFGRLPAEMQTGSDAIAPYFGTALTMASLTYIYHWDAAYRVNSLGSRTRPGDSLQTDMALQFRLLPWTIPETGLPSFFYADLETNLLWSGRGHLEGHSVEASGGTTWFVDPGIIFTAPATQSGVVVEVPVAQDLHGTGRLGYDFRVAFYLQHYLNVGSLFTRNY